MPFDPGLAPAPRLVLRILLLSLGAGCQLLREDAPRPAAEQAQKSEVDRHEPAEPKDDARQARPGRYGVPFAWETSPDEPLAKARTFIAEVLRTNDAFRARGREHFAPLAEVETPRATVLTCSDSRVQASAWDASPENDNYIVRNFGNQLATSLGSVEYGVERLHTPVLLIVGHTGCEAVRAVLNGEVKSKGGIAAELSRMTLAEPRPRAGSGEWDPLTAAVVAHVDAQVAEAVGLFSPFVQSGELTVVGAVYDFRNDFGAGHGLLRIVNVNSNVEEARLEAFEKAIRALEQDEKPAAAARGAKRNVPPDEPGRALFAGKSRRLPGTPRATLNAVHVLGSGGIDAVAGGTWAQPPPRRDDILPGTSDLKLARPARAKASE